MRVDPLLLLTLAGLAGAGLLAALHPTEALDVADPTAQAGRHVRVVLVVADVQSGADWWRGSGIAGAPHDDDTGTTLDWVWFRPPGLRALPGDRLSGTALVERDGDSANLLFDGPHAARIEPGPHPVPVAWRELLADPGGLAGRTLAVAGTVGPDTLTAPDGAARCPLHDDSLRHAGSGRWQVTLWPDPTSPAWRCRVEGPAP